MSISDENRAIAKHVLKAFGGTPSVRAYHHDSEDFSVDMLRCDDMPYAGVTSYSTIGLSDYSMLEGNQEFPARLEIAGACATADGSFANILASAAFCVMRTRRLVRPGSVLPEYVRGYYPGTTVPHLYLTAPFLWDERLTTMEFATKKVAWLMGISISDQEYDHLKKQGDESLEDLLERCQIDVFDLRRASAV